MEFVCEIVVEGVVCGKPYATKEGLLMHHVKGHNIKQDGICRELLAPGRECGMPYPKSHRARHKKIWHSTVKCRACNLSFPHKKLLMEHSDIHRKVWNCKFKCKFQSGTKEEMEEHERTCAKRAEVEAKAAAQLATWAEKAEERAVKSPCQVQLSSDRVCGEMVRADYQADHSKVWHSEAKCRACDRKFDHKQLMLEHYRDVHKKTWYCKNRTLGCQSKYPDKEKLAVHEANCDPSKKSSICGYDGCDRTFAWDRTLRFHLYYAHSLNVLQVEERLGSKDDMDESDDEDEEEEEEFAVPHKRLKVVTVPLDPETGEEFDKFKFGTPKWHFKPLDYGLFCIFYHYGLRVPIFTFQILVPAHLSVSHEGNKQVDQTVASRHFRLDRSLVKMFRRGKRDYDDIIFHRGHLVPFKNYQNVPDIGSKTGMFSNILPMYPEFNLSGWKRVEHATEVFAQAHVVTLVVTAGQFNDPIRMAGLRNVPIPNRFAKVLLGLNPSTGLWDLKVFDMAHNNESYTTDQPLSDYFGKLEDIEEQLNVQLFPKLPAEKIGVRQERQQQEQQQQYKHDANVISL